MSEYTPDKFKALLSKLVKTPEAFTPDDLRIAVGHLLIPDVVPPAQIGAFLAACNTLGLDRDWECLVAASDALRSRAFKAVVQDADKDFIVDIVGTGGDGHNTFNVSTTAAIVAAGAGARVVKHGGRASTSSSGSADVLQALGCTFIAPSPGTDENTAVQIPRTPFTFVFAPLFNPSLALVAPVRKSLPFRTLFNLVGPLLNPARPQGMVLGVADRKLGLPFAKCLRQLGVKRAWVVCGHESLDEISCATESDVWTLGEDGEIVESVVCPEKFGLPRHPLASVTGKDARENAATMERLLKTRTATEVTEAGLVPVMDFVLMNAAAVLVVAGIASDCEDGVRLAKESVFSGRAWDAFRQG